jgi:hypothetical protein
VMRSDMSRLWPGGETYGGSCSPRAMQSRLVIVSDAFRQRSCPASDIDRYAINNNSLAGL